MPGKLSDKDKDRLGTRLREMRERLTLGVQDMAAHIPDVTGANVTVSNAPTHPADNDSTGIDAEVALVHNEQDLLQLVDEALQRLGDGSFGKCQGCGKDIAKLRLDALPFTPYCVECAAQQDGAPMK